MNDGLPILHGPLDRMGGQGVVVSKKLPSPIIKDKDLRVMNYIVY